METPEGVELALPVAGPVPRLFAALLDALIRMGFYMAAALALSPLENAGTGIFLLTLFAGEWLYPVAFEVLRGGRTPGKSALGLRVVHDDGTPVGLPSSALRNLLIFADFLPLAYASGIVSTLFSPNFQRLGDLAAGTIVIHTGKRRRRAPLPQVPPEPPPVPLLGHEQEAIVEFAERIETWHPDRARELASIARVLTGATGTQGVKRLAGFAAWITGGRSE